MLKKTYDRPLCDKNLANEYQKILVSKVALADAQGFLPIFEQAAREWRYINDILKIESMPVLQPLKSAPQPTKNTVE